MSAFKFSKDDYETFVQEANFSNNMVDGETLTEFTATAMHSVTGIDASADVLSDVIIDGQSVMFRVKAGDVGATYIISISCVTSTMNKWNIKIRMTIT
jgi:hypothetical protein